MSFFRKSFIATVFSISMFVPLVSSAANDNSALIAQLLAQIKALQSQIIALQTQVQTNQSDSSTCTFTRNLSLGSRGEDVQCFQQFLINRGYTTSATGYYGIVTKKAAQTWQKDNDILPSSGFFGPASRHVYSQLISAKTSDVNARLDAVVSSPTIVTLNVTLSGNGKGMVVEYSYYNIRCGLSTSNSYYSDCSEIYSLATSTPTKILSAIPSSESSAFEGWAGCDSVNGTQCTVTMSSDKTVNARFVTIGTTELNVTLSGTGKGFVQNSSRDIYCGTAYSIYLHSYDYYTDCFETYYLATSTLTQILSAMPSSATSTFAGWTGCDSTNGTQCAVTMNTNKTVNARFDAVVSSPTIVTLNTSVSGNGLGYIFSSDGGIYCGQYTGTLYVSFIGTDCSETYSTSTPTLTLRATSSATSTFAGWTGCDSTNGTQCTVTMNTNKTVNARFDAVVPVTQSSITVTSPNGGETLQVGSSYTISWNATHPLAQFNVYLKQDHDANGTYETVQEISVGSTTLPLPANGSVQWIVPTTVNGISTVGVYAKIGLSVVLSNSYTVTDDSDTSFSIVTKATNIDLIVQSLDATAYGIRVRLCNNGTTASGPFQYSVAANGMTKINDHMGLSANYCEALGLPFKWFDITTSSFSGNVMIDSAQSISETNENNNESSATLTITTPLLISFSPVYASAGSSVTITGLNFTPTGNQLTFSGGSMSNYTAVSSQQTLNASSTTSLNFVIPQTVTKLYGGASVSVTSGTYYIKVSNANGNSDTVPLVVVAPTTSSISNTMITANALNAIQAALDGIRAILERMR